MKHIILAADNNYALPCVTAIASLLSHTNPENCDIHILTSGFDRKNNEILQSLKSRFPGSSIRTDIINPTETLTEAITSTRFPLANFFRLLIPQLYDFTKVLYLDCDVIVNQDITGLWDIPLEHAACGMAIDQNCDDILHHNRIRSYKNPYFNAGVLLMNLDYWRKEKISEKLLTFMKDSPECCLYPDQDAINKVLEDCIQEISPQYNVQESWYKPQEYWKVHRKRWKAIEAALQSPFIIHYTGDKPWEKKCPHPLAPLYHQYLQAVLSQQASFPQAITRYKREEASAEYITNFNRIEHRRKIKHIRRANLFTILFIIETLATLGYFLYNLL